MYKRSTSNHKFLPHGLSILHEDRDLLVVDKPAGLLTMGTDSDKTRTAYFYLTDYVRRGYSKSRNRIFIVHRLDRETSGIVIFAKNVESKFRLQDQWKDTKKKYLAVVHGQCVKTSGTITTYLAENKAHIVYSTSDRTKGKLSTTGYKVVKQTKDCALLELDLLTGRKHQIRVHLAGIGHAVVGDRKYGSADRDHTRLALHATSISFKHPFNGQQLTFESKAPAYFNQLVGKLELKEPAGSSQTAQAASRCSKLRDQPVRP
jgi:tRNA pseudouridine32 synthase/23S rRNA pseudouridine746 synthase/23S rRNA pseudouridine1911/1915/1917 synthase